MPVAVVVLLLPCTCAGYCSCCCRDFGDVFAVVVVQIFARDCDIDGASIIIVVADDDAGE